MNNINQVLALMPNTPEEIEYFTRLMNKEMLKKWNSIFNQLEIQTQIRLDEYAELEYQMIMEEIDESIERIKK